jgi:hypothetical protein
MTVGQVTIAGEDNSGRGREERERERERERGW